MQTVAMRIGGRDAAAGDGRYYEKRNPFTGELVARVPDAGPLDAAADAAARLRSASGRRRHRPGGVSCCRRRRASSWSGRRGHRRDRSPPRPAAPSAGGCSTARLAAGMLNEAAAQTTR